jgi:NAD(P)-dependent dehydrogenase (short-subunit alcohol dehydrogenase family)
MITQAGGEAAAVQLDHTQEYEVAALADRIRKEKGRFDILVNSVWGGDPMIDWSKKFWEIDLATLGAYVDQTILTHIISCRHFAPMMIEANSGLIVEMIDGHLSGYRGHILYDMTKAGLARLAYGMAMELADTGVTALALSPGFLRSEAVLDHFGVTEANWKDATRQDPYFAESETPMLSGRAIAALAADAHVGQKAGLIHFASDLAREYGFSDVDGRVPNFPKMLDENLTEMLSQPPLSDGDRFLAWVRYCQIHRDPRHYELASGLADALGLQGLGPGLSPSAPTGGNSS